MDENENFEPIFLPFSEQPFQKAESAFLTSSERQELLRDLSTWAETAACAPEAEPASPDTIPEVDATSNVVRATDSASAIPSSQRGSLLF